MPLLLCLVFFVISVVEAERRRGIGRFGVPTLFQARLQGGLTHEMHRHTILPMRTTILLADELAERFREAARARGVSLSTFLAEAGRNALKSELPPKESNFKLITYGSGGAQPGIDLNKSNSLIAAEDEERFGR